MKTVSILLSTILLFSCNSEKEKVESDIKEENTKSEPKENVKFEEIKSNDSSNIRAIHYKNGSLKDSLLIYKKNALMTSFYYKGINEDVFFKGGIVIIDNKKEILAKDVFVHEALIFIPMTDYNNRVYLYKYDCSSRKDLLTDGKELAIGSSGKVYVYKDEISILQSNVEGKFAVNKYKIAEHELLFKSAFQLPDDASESQLISKIVDSY